MAVQDRQVFALAGRVDSALETARRLRDSRRWVALAEYFETQPEPGLNLELALCKAEAALHTTNHHRAIEIADRVISSNDARLRPGIHAHALLIRAAASRLRGFTDRAIKDASDALDLLPNPNASPHLVVEGHKQLGIALAMSGAVDIAIEHFETALAMCSGTSNPGLEADVQMAFGIACQYIGRLPQAQAHYKNAVALYQQAGLRKELSTAYDNVGVLQHELGEYEAALEMLGRSLEIARETGTPRTEAMAQVNIGDVRLELGQFRDAIDAFEG
ncbi:MAG: tetratricopeptide repeat protein, partial [Chloroflexi bacterium]|nr:tetratricopeptide repeat protein [Chloroflexota bacterium]